MCMRMHASICLSPCRRVSEGCEACDHVTNDNPSCQPVDGQLVCRRWNEYTITLPCSVTPSASPGGSSGWAPSGREASVVSLQVGG
jgi:hypothetical protein